MEGKLHAGGVALIDAHPMWAYPTERRTRDNGNMDDSLESLLEKATNPRNKYEDWEFIMAFCDQVNAQPEGPQVALKIMVPKLRSPTEKVALLALTLLEACVKNCGQRFHQELGKFRFLNELIRMISPKYLGSQTPPNVRDKIKQLMYSWKVGLPQEPKIQEAFEMLKREGLIFDESATPDRTLQTPPKKPQVSVIEDPRQSEVLRKLLASKNPDDLRAANRLIREMVRRDEKRMTRLQKRLDELELIQNNTKLLSELLSHYKPDTGGEQEKLLIMELYSSLEKMQPSLFRMASELKPKEEGMAEILQANDSLIRVMDRYKKIMGESTATTTTTTTSTTSTTAGASGSSTTTSSASGGTDTKATASASSGGGGGSDVLIDLADLNFGPPPSTVASQDLANTSTSSSLLDDIGLLGTQTTPQTMPPINLPPFLSTLPSQPTTNMAATQHFPPAPSTLTPQTAPSSTLSPSFPLLPPPPQGFPPGQTVTLPQPGQTVTLPQPQRPQPPVSQTAGAATDLLGDLAALGLTTQPKQQQPSPAGTNIQQMVPQAIGGTTGKAPGQTPAGGSQPDPLAVLDDLFVAQESIQPGSLPPLQVVSKNGITVSFHIAKNSLSPNVMVIVISIISTNINPATNFQFQAAVPKVMRVKLQPPTGTELGAFNPILPPPNISQIMLLANPTKAKIRMKYRISYHQSGQEVVEMGEVSNFPVL